MSGDQASGEVPGSMTERAYARLKEEVLTAQRRPESLLLEQELAGEYGMSKTPVREALRLLAHEGWVLVLPRRGYLVRPLRFDDVREVFALRQMIEPALAVEAAKRASAEQFDALSRHIDDQAAAPDFRTALDAATAFHLDIASLAGNQRAGHTLRGLVDEVRRMHYLVPSLQSRLTEEAEVKDHRDLISAMRQLDIGAVHEIMERHARESLRQKLDGLTTL